MKLLINSIIGAALVSSASAASYTVNSGSAVNLGISGSDVQFVIPQFNTSLGTLTGVTVKVVQSTLTGSFEITNNGETGFTVDKVTTDFRVKQNTAGLGYAPQLVEIDPLVTTPSSNPSPTISPSASQIFTITAGQGYTISNQIIDGTYFAAYSGAGNVVFDIRNRGIVTVSGATYTVDTTNTYTTTQMEITYTYTEAIPEPSAAALAGLGALALLRRRRR